MNECADCKKLQDECPWEETVLDYCGYALEEETKRDIIEGRLDKVYPIHSSFRRCDKHKGMLS